MKIKYRMETASHDTCIDVTNLTGEQFYKLLEFLRLVNGVEDFEYLHDRR